MFKKLFGVLIECFCRSWAANNYAPTSKRGVGTAFMVSLSNCIAMLVQRSPAV